MELKNKKGSFVTSADEIIKIFESIFKGIKSLFGKPQYKEQGKNDDIRLPKFTHFSTDEFGIEDI